jgi:predicted nuclease of predicted toxin-antitoxin system
MLDNISLSNRETTFSSFQADADLNEIILKALLRRESSIDFQTATTANFEGADDIHVLSFATMHNRILVTHDQRTIPHHFAKFITNQTSSRVIIVPKRLPSHKVVDDLLLIWLATELEEWQNRILVLPI